MKNCNKQISKVACLILMPALTAACVNHFSDESKGLYDSYLLKFTASINEVTVTRVVDNAFEIGDEVGLFALAGTSKMKEERYVNNFCFVRSSDGEFLSSTPVYYPDDDVTLKLISYYPYQEEGVAMGESVMQVSVATSQNVAEDYSCSDFLVAVKEDVSPSHDAISLTYNHMFFRLKISIVPGDGADIEEILATNPELIASNFFTKVMYDFQEDVFLNYTEESDITSAGEWEMSDNKLVGKEMILIPQEMGIGYQYLTLKAGGKSYTVFFPSSFQLQSGKQRELEITFVPDEDILLSEVNGEITDWEGSDIDQTDAEFHRYVDVSQLTFEQSNVYKIINDGQQVAEICKEYIATSEFSGQAIVAYPMKDDHQTVDLSNGVAVQLIGEADRIHGGSVSWNPVDSTVIYTQGSLVAQKYVYVLADGQLSFSVSASDDILSVSPVADVVHDVRGGSICYYPIVKIGMQYWMRDNLEASLFLDGTEMPLLSAVEEDATGYLLSSSGEYHFYAYAVIQQGNLLPSGWSIPDWNDWNSLKTYLSNDASLLKSGTWVSLSGAEVMPANNLSGFNALPIGLYHEEYQSDYEGKYVYYWTLNEEGTEPAEDVLGLESDMNEFTTGKYRPIRAYAIRCIRK